MKKNGFSGEVLCLFFIITLAIMFGKILLDVKGAFGREIENLSKNHNAVKYQVYSNRNNNRIEYLKDITSIRSKEDLEYFKGVLKTVNLDIKWLGSKLENYDDEFFEEKTLVIVSIIIENNVLTTRVSDIYKTNDEIIVEVTKKMKDAEPTSKSTWFAVIEIENKDSEVKLDIIKN